MDWSSQQSVNSLIKNSNIRNKASKGKVYTDEEAGTAAGWISWGSTGSNRDAFASPSGSGTQLKCLAKQRKGNGRNCWV